MYKLILILIFFLTACYRPTIPPEDKTILDNYSGEWTLPKDFKEFKDHSSKMTTGKYTKIKVTGTDLIAGISPRFYKSDFRKKIISCTIDIEKPYANNKRRAVLAEINVPLENLNIKTIKGDIENIISVQGNTIKFNLGKETFEYTLNEKSQAQTVLNLEAFIKKYHKGNFIVSRTTREFTVFEDDPLFPKSSENETLTLSNVYFQIENTDSLGDILGRLKDSGIISFFEISSDNVLTIRFNQSIAITPFFIENAKTSLGLPKPSSN